MEGGSGVFMFSAWQGCSAVGLPIFVVAVGVGQPQRLYFLIVHGRWSNNPGLGKTKSLPHPNGWVWGPYKIEFLLLHRDCIGNQGNKHTKSV